MNFSERAKNYYWNLRADNSGLFDKSEVFCMAPWLQLHAQTNGKVAPCCMATVFDDNELGDLRQNPNLEEAWNSPNMKQLRLNMLNGKENTLCTHCYKYEKTGKFSERMMYNRDYKHLYPKVHATAPDGSLEGLDVPLIDIRFSNKCNYKCRICDSVYSSLWYEEEAKTGKIPGLPSTKEMKVATDELAFWKSYKHLLKNVKRLHFAGGEPLFMDEHYEALEYLISLGKTDVTLSYNTNFSTLRYKKYNVVDLWNKFDRIDIWASLDMMGDKGDYQRKGQKWERIEENIRTLQRECPAAQFGVNVTVNVLNILYIPDFFRYMVENKFVQPDRMNLYLLFDPDYLNVTNLTPSLKQQVVERFNDFEKNYLPALSNTENIRNHARSAITYMMSETKDRKKEFRHWISTIDALREENFIATFPELAEMMEPAAAVS